MGETDRPDRTPTPWPCRLAVLLALVIMLALMADQAGRSSATYDETTYLRVAAHWWRTGEQAEIARMGSPLTFWKIQQAPTLYLLDQLGRGDWIDDPIGHQARLLPVVRLGSLWIAAVALLATAWWARRLYGPRAMSLAAFLFALSPNLLAHGALSTMEMPLVAASAGGFAAFWRFLRDGDRCAFWAGAVLSGLAWSCKFTAVLIPPILAVLWWLDLRFSAARGEPAPGRLASLGVVFRGMLGFVAAMAAINLVLTGFATIPLSPHGGDHPAIAARLPGFLRPWVGWLAHRSFPQDWVAFAVQMAHQKNGGPSYLLGETRQAGWSYYYLVTLAVKVPIAVALLFLARGFTRHPADRAGRLRDRGWFPIAVVLLFLLIASLASKRNYGIRYLLPVAVPAIVWMSALAEGDRKRRLIEWAGVAGMGLSVGLIHPHELSYFNRLAGGPIGGRRILSDSNLDWGQGLRGLAALQRRRPELQDLTFYYFGDTDPAHYGVVGRTYTIDANHAPADLPPRLSATTRYLAVSSSLLWGPWGPPGYFRALEGLSPLIDTDDATIAIFRVDTLRLEERPGGGYDEARP
ncbi:ArnT family glycosyltransferase [Tundrisphaera sp. TA3]|uniref:ArnT family glycosyltransferase n=1 Tax=Tundrisphaera sp. TA3 TaxID=3435775 RepID=UPI003EB7551E